jgi:hypothetical protein
MTKTESFVLAAEGFLTAKGYVKQPVLSKKTAPMHSKWRTPDGDVLFMHAALHNVLEQAFCSER